MVWTLLQIAESCGEDSTNQFKATTDKIYKIATFPTGAKGEMVFLNLKNLCPNMFMVCQWYMEVCQIWLVNGGKSPLQIHDCNQMVKKSARSEVWKVLVQALH